MAIIGISGKKQSGKDTVGKLIQIIVDSPHFTDKAVEGFYKRELLTPIYKIKKFADKLKDMVCLLISCNRIQLEDEDFKSQELPEIWWYWKLEREGGYGNTLLPYLGPKKPEGYEGLELIKTTPRLLLQLIGTECGREIIHPNVWVNSLMSEYQMSNLIKAKLRRNELTIPYEAALESYPKWIITDVRFENEIEAIKQRRGLLIRIESPRCDYSEQTHISERALDMYEDWDEVIWNDGTILDLIPKVRKILIKRKIIDV